MTDRMKDWIAQNAVRLTLTAFLVGGAWFTLRAEVASKADKAMVEAMAQDIRDIKTLICRSYPGDSSCYDAKSTR
jgi:hypothetical protein